MIRLEMKKYDTKLSEKLQKYRRYNQVKMINMIFLQAKK